MAQLVSFFAPLQANCTYARIIPSTSTHFLTNVKENSPVAMLSSMQARTMRTAISARLAAMTLPKGGGGAAVAMRLETTSGVLAASVSSPVATMDRGRNDAGADLARGEGAPTRTAVGWKAPAKVAQARATAAAERDLIFF